MVLHRNLFQYILIINWHEQISRVCIDGMVEFVLFLFMCCSFPTAESWLRAWVGFLLSRWPTCIPEGLAGRRSLELHLEYETQDPLCPRSCPARLGWFLSFCVSSSKDHRSVSLHFLGLRLRPISFLSGCFLPYCIPFLIFPTLRWADL